jgi:Cu(I)/Ag(I) efflux system protein CusF
MRPGYVLSIAVMALAPAAHAQSDPMKGMDMKDHRAETAQAKLHHAAGVVKSVDAGKGTVTVAHGSIASLNWPAMTMTFKAADKKLLQSLKPGAQVAFDFEQRGKDYVITKIE